MDTLAQHRRELDSLRSLIELLELQKSLTSIEVKLEQSQVKLEQE